MTTNSVGLILTTFNEAASISRLLEDVLAQTVLPAELVLVDAGSRDRTVELARSFAAPLERVGCRLKVLVRPGAGIAAGRNEAIREIGTPWVAVTDAGCRLEATWLQNLARPLLDGRADFVGGFYRPVAHDCFQRALAALTTAPVPGPGFLPSSRSVAFAKSLWSRVGGYPEWLPWGEDTYFDVQLLKACRAYCVAADAIVHWEVRRSFKAVFTQYRRYSYGDGLARAWTMSGVGLPVFFAVCLTGAWVVGPVALLPLALAPLRWAWRKGLRTAGDLAMGSAVGATIYVARAVGFVQGIAHSLFAARRPATVLEQA